MGWIAYKAKSSKGNDVAVRFPYLEKKIVFPKRFVNITDLANNPDFPLEAMVFSIGAGVQQAADRGMGFVKDIEELANETWTFENGSTISFEINAPGQNGTIRLTYPNGDDYPNGTVEVYPSYVCFLPTVLTNPIPNKSETGASTVLEMWDTDPGYFFLDTSKSFPDTILSYGSYFFRDLAPLIASDDPYGDGGETEPGGGEGDFDNTSVDVTIPDLPTLSATDAGFITLFNPSLAELQNLSQYMWSDLFDVNGWKKIFADPMNAILGLSIVPVNVPAGTAKTVKVGNISTGISMTTAATQYVTLDCGTLDIKEYWGAYLDYDPYTKAEIYLPYIGTHALAVDDIMKKSVHVVYHIDILSGACCAYVQCGGTVLYSFVGQCSSSLPITGDDWTNVINGALNIAGSIGSLVASGGASAPFSAANIATAAVNSFKPSVEKSGAMSGTGGLLGVQTPYLILTRPRQALPRDQSAFVGYPSYITQKLEELSGYTEIESIHLENVPATESELSEIESLLKSGVIF